MFLPIGDSPNLPRTPWVTRTLIVINVVLHLALLPLAFQPVDPADPVARQYLTWIAEERGEVPPTLTRGDLVRFEYGFRPSTMQWQDMLTSMFLHAGMAHLLGNMLFLWVFGDNIEHRLGRLGFLAAYLGTGVAATLGDAALRWGSAIPSVGASGAISGVLGLYFVLFPRNTVRLFVFLFPFYINVHELPARWVLGAYLVLANLLPVLLDVGSGVAYGAHIGGFVAGWSIATRLGTHSPRRARRADPDAAGLGLHERFRDALWSGRVGEAAAHLFDLPRSVTRRTLSAADKVALGDALAARAVSIDDLRLALAAYQRALADHPTAAERQAAHLGAARMLLSGLGTPTGAYQHLYDVLESTAS
ncbi:MAG: rhomboid family intramembrane serine protease, partial [Acidobacteriota bacterium]